MEWWGWLLVSVAAWALCILAGVIAGADHWLPKVGCGLVAVLSGVIALLAFVIGIVRLVKWAWG
jgi:hypothetical protein